MTNCEMFFPFLRYYFVNKPSLLLFKKQLTWPIDCCWISKIMTSPPPPPCPPRWKGSFCECWMQVNHTVLPVICISFFISYNKIVSCLLFHLYMYFVICGWCFLKGPKACKSKTCFHGSVRLLQGLVLSCVPTLMYYSIVNGVNIEKKTTWGFCNV